jgi:hypothetical protein
MDKGRSLRRTPREPRLPTRMTLASIFPDFTEKAFQSRETARQRELLSQLRDSYHNAGIVLYVGAGVSRSLGLPSWSELIQTLAVVAMGTALRSEDDAFLGLTVEQRQRVLSSVLRHVAAEPALNRSPIINARMLKMRLGKQLPDEIARMFYDQFWQAIVPMYLGFGETKHFKYKLPSSPLVDSIVALARSERSLQGLKAIVNYNFDDFLDDRLREENVRCETILSGRQRRSRHALPCYHVHGLIPVRQRARMILPRIRYKDGQKVVVRSTRPLKAHGNFVFSEDQYHAEYSDPYRWSNLTQINLLSEHTGLFVGLSLEDPNIRRLIDVTHQQYPERVHYAVLTRKIPVTNSRSPARQIVGNVLEDAETHSFETLGVRVIWANTHDEIPGLLDRIREEQ